MQDIFSFMQHHWQLSAGLLGVLLLLILIEFIKQSRGTTGLTPGQATQLINHKDAVIVDLRDSDAFASGHIVGAISIPHAEWDTKQKKLEKFKTQPIVLVCSTGIDSLKKHTILQKKGLPIYTLTGGMRAWKEAGMPIVKN